MRVGQKILLSFVIGISALLWFVLLTLKGYKGQSCPNSKCDTSPISFSFANESVTSALIRNIRDIHESSEETSEQFITANEVKNMERSTTNMVVLPHRDAKTPKVTAVNTKSRRNTAYFNHLNLSDFKKNYMGLKKLPRVFIRKDKKTEKQFERYFPKINTRSDDIDELHSPNISNETENDGNTTVIVYDNYNITNSVNTSEHRLVADLLRNKIRILCWLYDTLNEHMVNVAYVKDTWGKHCNVLLFMTNHSFSFPPIIRLHQNKEMLFFYGPIKEAFKYVFEHHRNDADWFMMVDYTTFVVVENLRYMLLEFKSTNPIWLFNRILSRGGLDSFIWHAENNLSGCAYDDSESDILMCLSNIGVKVRDTSDELGCSRYFDLSIFSLMGAPKSMRDHIEKLNIFTAYKECNSENAVAFQLNTTSEMTEIYFMIYHMHAYGINNNIQSRHTSTHVGEYPLQEIDQIRVTNWMRLLTKSSKLPKIPVKQEQSLYTNGSTALALSKEIRVLCWVLTYPKNHERKAAIIKATWGKRCNILLFMSTEKDPSLPTIALPVEEGWNYIWGKTRAAFEYIYVNHRDDADWFLKADDDTFVIVENLRHMLSSYDESEPLYTGCWFKLSKPAGNYMSGGAGYVISRGALDKFFNAALKSPSLCINTNFGAEDINMGRCLANVGVKFIDSRDSLGRARFLPFSPTDHLSVGLLTYESLPWYFDYLKFNISEGINCCSEYAITFHYITPDKMHQYYYFLYQFRLFGINYDDKYIPRKRTPHNVSRKIIKQEPPNQSKTTILDYWWKFMKTLKLV